ncbi:MAG: alpha/beta fold hydrolase, partial [Actinomycetes bacterium]
MRRRSRRLRLGVAGVLALALVAVAAALGLRARPTDPLLGPSVAPQATTRPLEPVPSTRPPGVTEPPPGTGLSRYTGQQLTWRPCRGALQCANVLAPLDYAAPDGPAVTLVMARLGNGRARLGSLFLNPGGPGGSGLDLLAAFDRTGLEAYDLVSWDPRGVGESTPVRCFAGQALEAYVTVDVSPDDAAERDRLLRGQTAFNRSCLKESGVLLPHISTADTVADLDLLRGLLNQPKLNYLGFSYGTQIGAIYADRYGPRVGRMVLDGAVDLHDQSVPQAQGFERALRNFATWCARRRCPLGQDRAGVLATVTGLWRRLDAEPMPVGDRELNQTLALSGALTLLYEDERSWPILVTALDAANRRDGRGLLRLADVFNRRG